MAFGALASGLIGATQAAGEDAGQRMKLANEEASRKRILDMTEEANMDFKKRLDEYTFQKEGERLPETLRREGLMNQAKRDPLETGLRKLQLEKAGLELNRAKEEAKIPAAESKLFDSLGKRASAYESAILKAQADGNFDANSDSGKKLLSDYQSVILQQQQVLSPYLKQSDTKSGTNAFDPSKFDRSNTANAGNSNAIKSDQQQSTKPVEMTKGQKAAAQRREELAGKVHAALNAGEKSRVEREAAMAANRAKAGY